jgi:hypothetical protein
MTHNYYVYYYLRAKNSSYAPKGSPYYVGKGIRNRIIAKHTTVTTPKNPALRIKVAENLTEQEAYDLETVHIRKWGRKDIGTGILLNRTDGGRGAAGNTNLSRLRELKKINSARRGLRLSDSHKIKISQSLKDLYKSGCLRPNIHTFTQEQKARISSSVKLWREGLTEAQKKTISDNISEVLRPKGL